MPHRPDTWTDALFIYPLYHVNFLTSFMEWFRFFFSMAWQWKPRITCLRLVSFRYIIFPIHNVSTYFVECSANKVRWLSLLSWKWGQLEPVDVFIVVVRLHVSLGHWVSTSIKAEWDSSKTVLNSFCIRRMEERDLFESHLIHTAYWT